MESIGFMKQPSFMLQSIKVNLDFSFLHSVFINWMDGMKMTMMMMSASSYGEGAVVELLGHQHHKGKVSPPGGEGSRHPRPTTAPSPGPPSERAHRHNAGALIGCERQEAAVDKWWQGGRTMPRQWGCVLPQ